MLLLAARGRSDGAGGVTAPPQRTFRRSHSLGRSLPAHGIHLEGGLPASTGRCLPSQSPAVPGQLGGRNYPGGSPPERGQKLLQASAKGLWEKWQGGEQWVLSALDLREGNCSGFCLWKRVSFEPFKSKTQIHSRPGLGVTRIIKNVRRPHPLSVVANTRSDILPFATL